MHKVPCPRYSSVFCVHVCVRVPGRLLHAGYFSGCRLLCVVQYILYTPAVCVLLLLLTVLISVCVLCSCVVDKCKCALWSSG